VKVDHFFFEFLRIPKVSKRPPKLLLPPLLHRKPPRRLSLPMLREMMMMDSRRLELPRERLPLRFRVREFTRLSLKLWNNVVAR